jgi:hypothetical protein
MAACMKSAAMVVVKRALNGFLTVYLFFADMISDVQVRRCSPPSLPSPSPKLRTFPPRRSCSSLHPAPLLLFTCAQLGTCAGDVATVGRGVARLSHLRGIPALYAGKRRPISSPLIFSNHVSSPPIPSRLLSSHPTTSYPIPSCSRRSTSLSTCACSPTCAPPSVPPPPFTSSSSGPACLSACCCSIASCSLSPSDCFPSSRYPSACASSSPRTRARLARSAQTPMAASAHCPLPTLPTAH